MHYRFAKDFQKNPLKFLSGVMVPYFWLYPPSLESCLSGKERKHDQSPERRHLGYYLKLLPTLFNNYAQEHSLEQSFPTGSQPQMVYKQAEK